MSGLTIVQTVRQSTLVHPDWTFADHCNYLLVENGFDPTAVHNSFEVIRRTMEATLEEMNERAAAEAPQA